MHAGLWTLHDESMNRLFSKALPIADGDHGLHHATVLLLCHHFVFQVCVSYCFAFTLSVVSMGT